MIIDFRLFETIAELQNYKDFLATMEVQEKMFAENKWNELLKYTKSLGIQPDDVEWDMEQQQYEYETEYLYPKSLRGTFLISIWATFEAGIQEIANLIQSKKALKLKLSDIRSENILDQFHKYFSHILEFDLQLKAETMRKLNEIYLLRNCYAHSNGRIDALKGDKKNKVNTLIKQSDYLHEKYGYITIDMEYLHEVYDVINKELLRIIEHYKLWDDKHSTT